MVRVLGDEDIEVRRSDSADLSHPPASDDNLRRQQGDCAVEIARDRLVEVEVLEDPRPFLCLQGSSSSRIDAGTNLSGGGSLGSATRRAPSYTTPRDAIRARHCSVVPRLYALVSDLSGEVVQAKFRDVGGTREFRNAVFVDEAVGGPLQERFTLRLGGLVLQRRLKIANDHRASVFPDGQGQIEPVEISPNGATGLEEDL